MMVFDLIRRDRRWLTVSEIAQKTATPERSVRFVLSRLTREGIVEKKMATYRMVNPMTPAAQKTADKIAAAVKQFASSRK